MSRHPQGVDLVAPAEELPALKGEGHVAVLPHEVVEGAEVEGVPLLPPGGRRRFR
jgi:hypothetical protein